MVRDLDALKDKKFDILVIGGGISGACLAWDASLRGLKVALIEKEDFGHGTSAATSKMLHGGLRYLANYEFKVVRESLRERRHLAKIMPHLAFPLPFLLPVYKNSGTPKWMLRIGLFLYDLLSFDKNFINDPDKYLSNHKWYNKEEALSLEPNLEPKGLKGAFHYYDAQNRYPERANLEFVLSAADQGATVANYLEVTDFTLKDEFGKQRIEGVTVQDNLKREKPFKIRANVVINATGPWADNLIQSFSEKKKSKVVRSKGIHLLFPKLINQSALAFETKDRRHFFVIPWLNYTLIGTTDTSYEGDLNKVRVNKAEVEEFLEQVNSLFPANLTIENVLHSYCGIRPLAAQDEGTGGGTYNISRKHELVDHGKKNKVEGLFSVFGGKWTTSRALAQYALDIILKRMNIPALPCNTAKTQLSGDEIPERFTHWRDKKIAEMSESYPVDTATHLIEYYGAKCNRLFDFMQEKSKLKKLITRTNLYCIGQIEYAVKHEMAFHLSDFMMRRSLIGNTGIPAHETTVEIAEHMGRLLGWSKAEREKQMEEYFEQNRITGL
ncbi:MAG: glycerol-3-phosphate dehydrogenase/oxidase [Leptospirales bacterium]